MFAAFTDYFWYITHNQSIGDCFTQLTHEKQKREERRAMASAMFEQLTHRTRQDVVVKIGNEKLAMHSNNLRECAFFEKYLDWPRNQESTHFVEITLIAPDGISNSCRRISTTIEG